MVPKEPLRLVKLPEKFRGVFSNIYVCRDVSGKEFLFKYVKSERVVLNELLAYHIGKVAGVSVFSFLEHRVVDGKDGLLMPYLKDDVLLAKYGRRLDSGQLRKLRSIVLFDLLVGNRDRHSGNILVGTKGLVAFDHGRVFVDRSSPGIKFVKLDVGRFLDVDYVDKVHKISAGTVVSTRDFLVGQLGFSKDDFYAVKCIKDSELRRTVDTVKCPKKVRNRAYNYVAFRKKAFDTLSYC